MGKNITKNIIPSGTKVSNNRCNFLIWKIMKKMFNIKIVWFIITFVFF
jgi:hypothetical protein